MSERLANDAPCALIARPGARAAALECALWETAGLVTCSLEIMTLVARTPTACDNRLLYDLDNFRHVICTSPFAAECLIEAIEARWPQLPTGLHFHATGPSTAEVLTKGLGVEVSAPAPGSGSASEALLALPGLARVNGARILLVAGEGGRELLVDSLIRRGAEISRLALYERRLAPPAEPARGRLESGRFAVLIVTSAEQLLHLIPWCSARTRQRPLVVSSERLATMAESRHFTSVLIAGDATPRTLALTSALARQQAAGLPPKQKGSDT